MDDEDEWLWLEDVDGQRALAWVRERNEHARRTQASRPGFDALRASLLEAMDSQERIPYVSRRGRLLYNFWQDAAHPRGLWRRTTPEQYRRAEPEWELLLDVDALAEAEGENWVWQGAAVLRPGFRRALLHLSRGGADAAVVREFDLEARRFVPEREGGFVLPEAKSQVDWIDQDHLFVGTDFGPGSLTDSGYPRTARLWRRGTPLAEAETVYEGRAEDVSVGAHHDPTPGFERDFVHRAIDFYRSQTFLRRPDGTLVRIEVPEDADSSVHREWLLVRPRTPWRVGEREYPAGALLAARFEDWLADGRDLEVLFAPDERTFLEGWSATRGHLLLTVLQDVRSHLRVLTPGPDGWSGERLPEPEAMAAVDVVDTEPDEDDGYLTVTSGFLTPPTLAQAEAGGGGREDVLRRGPEFFPAEGLTVDQHFAVSEDGTRVPYFVVGPEKPEGAASPAARPVLLSGYGGFEVSETPAYSAVIGRGWLRRGGVYVLACIRGGGEYGPQWHAQAVKSGRHKVYEDFAAVARDLIARGIATPATLTAQGGSNGGLLMGNMLTHYPELFAALAIQVPLLDMKRYHLLLAGASWTAEYGDPDVPEEWEYLRHYSPYQQLRAEADYPPVLLATSTRDDRVHPGHARKAAARLLAQGHDVTYYENVEGGHGGAADHEQSAFLWALVLDYLWQRAGGGEGESAD